MWKCRCGTENSTPRKGCYSWGGPKDADVETLPLGPVCIFIAFLIAFAATMIGAAYQIPALNHYGYVVFLLSLGFGLLILARADQTRGATINREDLGYIDIKKKEYPFWFWLYVGTHYAAGIFLIVWGVISFFAPNPLF